MKIFRLSSFLLIGLSVLLGTLLLRTSQSVQQRESNLARIMRAAEQERETIRVLSAEWAYLNSPARLESLTESYLDIAPPVSSQFLENAQAIPEPWVPVLPSVKPDSEKILQASLNGDVR